MRQLVPESWRPLLHALCKSPAGLTLQAAAKETGLSVSAVHKHLAAMGQEGFIQRQGGRSGLRYVPVPSFLGFWMGPMGADRQPNPSGWGLLDWAAHGSFSLQFPLVARVRDAEGRVTADRFLQGALERGFLTPWLRPPALDERGLDHEQVDGLRKEYHDPRRHQGLTFVAYGSCVRGDARRDSDLDLLAVTPDPDFIFGKEWRSHLEMDWEDLLQDLASDVNLGAVRTIDLRTIERDRYTEGLPAGLRASIETEGVTILSTVRGGEWIEARRTPHG